MLESWHKKGNPGAQVGYQRKSTVTAEKIKRQIYDILGKRLERETDLSDVSTHQLMQFLAQTAPKDLNVTRDTTIVYKSNIPKLPDPPKVIDVTSLSPSPDVNLLPNASASVQ